MDSLNIPRVGLAAIIFTDYNQVLLGKRKGSHGAGTWSFPGGKLEFKEDHKTRVLIEVGQETGLDLKLIDEYPCAITNDIFEKENLHFTTLYFRARYDKNNGQPQNLEPEKCEGWTWFYWSELPSPLFLPVQNLIKQHYSPFK